VLSPIDGCVLDFSDELILESVEKMEPDQHFCGNDDYGCDYLCANVQMLIWWIVETAEDLPKHVFQNRCCEQRRVGRP
tara:strand:+ start:131 stop:364 length:234 start_codon:yes stop_codon:yes gene_type:complete